MLQELFKIEEINFLKISKFQLKGDLIEITKIKLILSFPFY